MISSRTQKKDSGDSAVDAVSRTTAEQVAKANATGRTPVVFVHGLWLLPSSWDRWAALFEQAGYPPVSPGWPDDPETVDEAKAHPEVFARKSVGQIADHYAEVIGRLNKKPAVIGHSFGGLVTQILAGRGLNSVTVAIDPAPFRGVLPLPISALKAASPVLGNPANRNRAVPLTFEQFRYGFANVVTEDEAKKLYETFAVPGSGETVFQAAAENLNPWTEAKVDTKNPDRGPLLIIEEPGRYRDSRASQSWSLARHRQRLARGGRHGPRIRQATHEVVPTPAPGSPGAASLQWLRDIDLQPGGPGELRDSPVRARARDRARRGSDQSRRIEGKRDRGARRGRHR